MDEKYYDFYVTDRNGNSCGYYDTYEESLKAASEHEQSSIFGASWEQSGVKGLLQKQWTKLQ